MTIGVGSICFSCRYLQHDFMSEGPPTCDAYPEGIPDAIYYGAFDHRVPFGDEELDDMGQPILYDIDPDDPDAATKLANYEELRTMLDELENEQPEPPPE